MYFGAEGGILLAEGPAVLEVVDRRSVEETSALECGGLVLLGRGFDGPSMKILLVVVCKLQRTVE